MKNYLTSAYKVVTTTVVALGTSVGSALVIPTDANAACNGTGTTGCGTIPDPIIIPSPSNTGNTTNTNTNNPTANATSGAIAGAVAGSSSTSGAVAGVKTGDIGSTSSAKTDVKTGDVKTGDVVFEGSKIPVASATAIATGTAASGLCSQSDGGWAVGGQFFQWGASVSRNSGTSYRVEDVEFTDANGQKRIEKRNVCTGDVAALKQIDQGMAPHASKNEKKLGLAVAMELSPIINSAVRNINDKAVSGFFDEEANTQPPAAPPVQYKTDVVDATGTVPIVGVPAAKTEARAADDPNAKGCPKGTKQIYTVTGIPVFIDGYRACEPK